jgi:uncharacterized membrane protein
MRVLQSIVLVTSTITTGLIAGLFFAYACSAMPALAKFSDRDFVATMQSINRAILNPFFLLPFVGSLPLIAAGVLLAWRGYGRPALPWLIAALVLYGLAFVITSAVNVPLNNELEAAGDVSGIADVAAVRERFEARWVTWNIVRTVVHSAAFGTLVWALVVYRPR